jgi:hypothetical protein
MTKRRESSTSDVEAYDLVTYNIEPLTRIMQPGERMMGDLPYTPDNDNDEVPVRST